MNQMTPPPKVEIIPTSAPFSEAQRSWLNGFFAGLLTTDGGPAALSAERIPALASRALRSRSDHLTVAVGFNPRHGSHYHLSRGATIDYRNAISSHRIQPSLHDGGQIIRRHPWVETHGYPQSSLRDGELPASRRECARRPSAGPRRALSHTVI